jgi:hypothetical protein
VQIIQVLLWWGDRDTYWIKKLGSECIPSNLLSFLEICKTYGSSLFNVTCALICSTKAVQQALLAPIDAGGLHMKWKFLKVIM